MDINDAKIQRDERQLNRLTRLIDVLYALLLFQVFMILPRPELDNFSGENLKEAIVNSSGQWFYGLLFTQTGRSVDPDAQQPSDDSAATAPIPTNANLLGIVPFLAYRFGTSGYYVQTADICLPPKLYLYHTGKRRG